MTDIKNKTKFIVALPICLLIFISGCAQYKHLEEKEEKILNLGIVPSESRVELIEQYTPFSEYISESTDIKLRVIPLENYNEIYSQILDGFVDIGVFGSYGAAKGIRDYKLYPIARPIKKNNRSVYRGLIFTKKKYGIKDISELEGKSFAYVNKETSAGYFFPRKLIRNLGKNPDSFFSEVVFAGRHDLAIAAVMNEEVIAGCAKDDIYSKTVLENPEIKEELVILHESIDFPDRTFLINPTISNEVILELQQEMLSMHENKKGREVLALIGFKKFIKTGIEDFDQTLKMDIE